MKTVKIVTGKRKTAVARAIVKPGKGALLVNGMEAQAYFKRPLVAQAVMKPFVVSNTIGKFDVEVNVRGGGLTGQAGAVRHAIAKAINELQPELRSSLKVNGLLTRDSRKVERKKYGHKKARRSFQFSKR
ncbi:MAG: 30S ribosomal protein S9 [Spirochaetes bacterium]|nr:30S ribosomal protein S9 [Spirochaetota bacterium]